MPGTHVTDEQVRKFMNHRQTHSIEIAAAKSGFSRATGYRMAKDPPLPSQNRAVRASRRPDPLGGLFEREVIPMLERNPKLRAVAVYDELLRTNPQLNPNVRRTVERRIKDWRLHHGTDREVFFTQRHRPGQMGISDFTDMGALGVSIAGQPLDHKLYHFRLPWSGFTYAQVVVGGESFEALAQGLQDALWTLGGAPAQCRTDSLSAAFRNLDRDAKQDVTVRYAQFCEHYGMKATRNNRGLAHENGAIESPHGHLKRMLGDALMLRGSRDFDTMADYQQWISQHVGRVNARNRKRIEAELGHLQALPKGRTTDYRQARARVTSGSGFMYSKVFYTVPSRLIGQWVNLRVYDQTIGIYVNGTHQLDVPRRRFDGNKGGGHVIDYRHVIHSLKRKPMALVNYVYRDQVFPRAAYRRCFELALERTTERQACKLAVGLLALAHERNCEVRLAEAVEACVDAGRLPQLCEMRQRFEPDPGQMPTLSIRGATLDSYASLLGGAQ